jgi:hypothetical protein
MASASDQIDGNDPTPAGRPIRMSGATLGRERDVCAFFGSHDDQYRVLLPFIHGFFVPPAEFIREVHARTARDARPAGGT